MSIYCSNYYPEWCEGIVSKALLHSNTIGWSHWSMYADIYITWFARVNTIGLRVYEPTKTKWNRRINLVLFFVWRKLNKIDLGIFHEPNRIHCTVQWLQIPATVSPSISSFAPNENNVLPYRFSVQLVSKWRRARTGLLTSTSLGKQSDVWTRQNALPNPATCVEIVQMHSIFMVACHLIDKLTAN